MQSLCPSVTWTFCHVIWECGRQKSYDSVLGPDALGHHVSKDTELLLTTTYCDSQYNILERCPLFWLWLPLQKVNEYPSWESAYSLCSMGMKFAWIPSTCVLFLIVLTKHCTCSSTYRWRQQTILSWALSVMQYVMHRLLRKNKLWKN